MTQKRISLNSGLLALAIAWLFAASAAFGGATIIVGTSPQSPVTEELIKELIAAAEGGTRLIVFDATTGDRWVDFEISKSTAKQARLNAARAARDTLQKRLGASKAIRNSGEALWINAPQFFQAVASSLKKGSASPRVIVVAGVGYADPRDPGASFGVGQFPSDAHILADSMTSAWGTADRRDILKGVAVDWVTLGETGSQREHRAVQRFYGVYLGELGATLTSFSNETRQAWENATQGVLDPVAKDEIDRADKRLEIRAVKPIPTPAPLPSAELPPPEPAPAVAPTAREPVSLTEPVAHDVDLVIVIDGTSSMKSVLSLVGRMVKRLARLGATLTPRFTVGVVVYRDATIYSQLDPVEVSRPNKDIDEYTGAEAIDRFVDEPQIQSTLVYGSVGERATSVSGKQEMVSHMTGLLADANIEAGITTGVGMLKKGRAKRQVFLLVGDVGPSETDHEPGVSAADQASGERAIQTVRNLIADGRDLRVIALYTGGSQTVGAADTAAFFRRIAGLAGAHGDFTDSILAIDEKITRAMLAP